MFEEEELMPFEVKPITNETILNLNYAIQCGADEDMLTSYLASIKVGDGSTITTEWFNAADAHKLIRPSCYSGRTFADGVCSKRILWSWHRWEEKSVWKSKRSYWHQI